MLLSFTTNGFPTKKAAQDNAWRWDWHCGELTKDEIKRGIRNGCIFSQAITNDGTQPTKPDKRNNCIGFQSLWIDIDHNGKKTIDEQIEALAKKPSLAYTTYSHNPDKKEYRYRMIYLLDEPIYCSYERYTDIYAAFVKILMRKPDPVLQEWFKSTNKVGFEGFGVDMHLQTLSQIEFTTTPEAETREYDTILKKSDIERLSVGYTGETETTPIRNTSSASEKIYTYTTYEQDKSWWDADKERLYVRAYNSEDYLIHCNGYDVRGDGYDMMPERYRYCSVDIAGNKIWGLYLNKWKKGEGRKYIVNRAAQILLHNVPTLTDEEVFHFLIRWSDNVMYRNSGGDIITDDMLRYSISYAHTHPWEPSPKAAKKNPVNSVIIDRTSSRWAGMGSRKPAGIVRSERRIQRAIDGICYGIKNNLNLAEMVEWINGRKEENTTNKIYGRAFSEKSLLALVRKLYKKVIVDNEAYASADNVIFSLSFDNFFHYSSDILRIIELNRKRRNTNWERIMEMHQQGMTSLEISKALGISKQYVNRQISFRVGGNKTERFQAPKKPSTTNRGLNSQNLVSTNTLKGYKVLERLLSGDTILKIASDTGINEKTIRGYIKKAKGSGILRNEGTRKFPKWVMTSDNVLPESLDSIIKETEFTKEEIKEKTIKDMNTNDYNFDEFLNDVMPSTPTVPDMDFGTCISDYSSAVTQSTPTVSVAMPEEAEVEAVDNDFKAKAKTVFADNLNEPSATEDDLPEDMPEEMMNITMDVKPVKAMRYISDRDEPDTGVIPTEEQRKELRGKLAAIIARYDSDVEGVVRKCKGFYFSFSHIVSGNDMYRNNPWRKSMEDEMNCSDILISQLFLELKSEVVVAA